MVGEEGKKLQEFLLVFSKGPRGCIGRNITYMEQSVMLRLWREGMILSWRTLTSCRPDTRLFPRSWTRCLSGLQEDPNEGVVEHKVFVEA